MVWNIFYTGPWLCTWPASRSLWHLIIWQLNVDRRVYLRGHTLHCHCLVRAQTSRRCCSIFWCIVNDLPHLGHDVPPCTWNTTIASLHHIPRLVKGTVCSWKISNYHAKWLLCWPANWVPNVQSTKTLSRVATYFLIIIIVAEFVPLWSRYVYIVHAETFFHPLPGCLRIYEQLILLKLATMN